MNRPALLPATADSPDSDLPVRAVLNELCGVLSECGAAVLVAPPGSGKTTLVPLALADLVKGRIIVAEPRKVAARAAARRMAALTGTVLGEQIGYSVRGDRKVSAATRVEVVTTGVLVQRLQRDPELAGVAGVIVDECHERHLDTDLAVAFTVDVRANLRDDLWLLATSATAEAGRLAAAIGPRTPVVSAEASPHPVEVIWRPPERAIAPPHGLKVDPKLLDHVAATVRFALSQHDGDLLAFLPGAGEISQLVRRLSNLAGIDVLTLHGSQSAQTQDAALRAGPRRRVVLASAVAESSLTVPGVRIVVDAGLSREPRTDHARGLDALVTVRVSRASAQQRAGRAAREAPGTVYRCWSQSEHDRLAAHARPEIATADLTAFVLQLARWGSSNGDGLSLLDRPPEAAYAVALQTLTTLGALDAAGRISRRGHRMAEVGAHPRLARALLDGAAEVGARRAAETVALLSADVSLTHDDLVVQLRRMRAGDDRGAAAWRTEVRRLRNSLPRGTSDPESAGGDLAAGLVVGMAFPERLALIRSDDAHTYLMTGGTAAELSQGSGLSGVEWLAIAEADRQPGRAGARIRLAAAVDEATAVAAARPMLTDSDEVSWSDSDVRAVRVARLGAVVLRESRLQRPRREQVTAALLEGLRLEGLALLRFDDHARTLRSRIAFCRENFGAPWPAVDDAALVAQAPHWLAHELSVARRRADLAKINVAQALRRLLPWQQAAELDRLAPERMEVPSGSKPRLDYSDPRAPVLAVKVQECFGWTATPTVADGRVRVVLHLLSPAGRPAAVTADLASFWSKGYRQVRAELRGRYPKHPWPQDPMTATPTRRLNRPKR